MARAYGANAQLLGKFETVYGTPPTGNYIKFPFVSSDLGSEQGLIASDLLGQGRDPSQPIRDVIRVEGNVVVPVDLRNFGHWLKALARRADDHGQRALHAYLCVRRSQLAQHCAGSRHAGSADLLHGSWRACEFGAVELRPFGRGQRHAELHRAR
jgi:hypothetical protein